MALYFLGLGHGLIVAALVYLAWGNLTQDFVRRD